MRLSNCFNAARTSVFSFSIRFAFMFSNTMVLTITSRFVIDCVILTYCCKEYKLLLRGHVLQTQELIQILKFKTHPVYSLPSLPILSLDLIFAFPYQLVGTLYHPTSIFDVHLFFL